MEELRKIVVLSASDDTVIVGGMAVSILAEVYAVYGDAPCITTDADFLGGHLAIEESERQLAGYALRKYLATLDDQATPNSGKLAVNIGPNVAPVEIDFLLRIDGLSTDEIEEKAVRVEIDHKLVRVMHPVLLLENKLNNLALYPAKRDEAGINQARLAIAIARAYVLRLVQEADTVRSGLVAIERIVRYAQREASCYVHKAFGLEVLAAIPAADAALPRSFAVKRWPQVLELVTERRAKFDRLWQRTAPASDLKSKRFRV